MSRKSIYLMSFVLVLAVMGTASAADKDIFVPDAGFDDQVIPAGSGYTYVGEGNYGGETLDYPGPWQSDGGDAWIQNHYEGAAGLQAMNGDNFLYAAEEAIDDTVYQILDETFLAGATYTLSVWVGQAWDDEGTSWALYFTGENYQTNLIQTSGSAPVGSWEQVSLKYKATGADAGNKIGIKIKGDAWLSVDDVTLSYNDPVLAFDPNPANEQTEVLRDVILNWTPGENLAAVNGHIVYLSENFDDVNDGVGGITHSADSYDAGRLKFGTTYYWRVDEVAAPPASTVYPGDVWSFTTELFVYPIPSESITATASSSNVGQGPENTVNSSGVDANDLHSANPNAMWISEAGDPGSASIQYEFDKPYKLHEMLVWNYNGNSILTLYGLKEVTIEYSTDGTNWSQLDNISEFAQAIGDEGYAANTTVAFNDAAAKYVKITANSNWGGGGFFNQYGLSEVRFPSIPVSARKPNPEIGATGVAVDAILGWRPGREAVTHNVYVSGDPNALILAGPVTEPAFDIASLDLALGQTYHWRVDEVNDAETTTTWQGGLWSFTTQEYRVVEDFESYNDIDPPNPESHTIFGSWSDGYLTPATNGALVGYEPAQPPSQPSYMEHTIVYDGKQSMPLSYDNSTAPISVATRTFDQALDWTVGAPVSLSLYIRGMGIGDLKPANDGQPIYVVITDSSGQSTTVSYKGGDATATVGHKFEAWVIPLADLAPVNLSSIKSIGIGVGTPGGAPSGAKGTIYVDLIAVGLSTPAPAAGPKPTVWTEKASYSPFEPIVFHFTNADGVSAYDWIGFMVTGDPSSSYLDGYIYLDHVTDGSVTLEAGLGEFGIYDVRLFWDDSYIIEAANVFTIE